MLWVPSLSRAFVAVTDTTTQFPCGDGIADDDDDAIWACGTSSCMRCRHSTRTARCISAQERCVLVSNRGALRADAPPDAIKKAVAFTIPAGSMVNR